DTNLATTSGNVGIGTVTPLGLLQVGTSPNVPLIVKASGNVGIGTTAPNYNLEVASTGYFGGDVKLGTGTFDHASGAADAYITGNLEVDGSTWLGDAAADTLTVVGSLTAANVDMTIGNLTIGNNLSASTGNVSLSNTSGNLALGNDSGTFALASSGLDISTGGAISNATTLSMDNQLTNSYANSAAINLSGNASGITFGGTGTNQIITGGTNSLALMPGGNVGIGTTLPAEVLDVNGRLRLAQASVPISTTDKLYNVAGDIYWNGAQLNSPGGVLPAGDAGQTLRSDGESWLSTSVLFNDGTNVGIGTDNPSLAKLTLNGKATIADDVTDTDGDGTIYIGKDSRAADNDYAPSNGSEYLMWDDTYSHGGKTGWFYFSAPVSTTSLNVRNNSSITFGSDPTPPSVSYDADGGVGGTGAFTFSKEIVTEGSSPAYLTFSKAGENTLYSLAFDAQALPVPTLQLIKKSVDVGTTAPLFEFDTAGSFSVFDSFGNKKTVISSGKSWNSYQRNLVRNASFESKKFINWATVGTTTPTNPLVVIDDAANAKFDGHYAKINTGTSGTAPALVFSVPAFDVARLRGKQISVSLWARSASGTPSGAIGYTYSAADNIPSKARQLDLTTTWQNFTWTFPQSVPDTSSTVVKIFLYPIGVNNPDPNTGVNRNSPAVITSQQNTIFCYFDGITLTEGPLSIDYGPSPITDTGGDQVIYGNLAIGSGYDPYLTGDYTLAPRLTFGEPDSSYTGYGSYGMGSGEIRFLQWSSGGGRFEFNRSIMIREDQLGNYGASLVVSRLNGPGQGYHANTKGDAFVLGRLEVGGNVVDGEASPVTSLVVGNAVQDANINYATAASDAYIKGNLEVDGMIYGTISAGTGAASFGQLTVTGNTYLATTSGKVGIGTSSPSAGLTVGVGSNDHVNQTNSAYIAGNLEVDGSTWLGDAAADTLTVVGTLTATNVDMTIGNLTIGNNLSASTGNVSLSNTSGNLTLGNDSGTFALASSGLDISTGGAISNATTLSMNNQLTNSYANSAAVNLTGNASGITFGGTGTNQIITGGTNDLALMPGGNVGMGTVSPNAPLELIGSDTTSTVDMKITSTSSTIYLGEGKTGPHGIIFGDASAGEGLQLLYRTTPNRLIVENAIDPSVDGADLFFIDRNNYAYFSGNVGIGTTAPDYNLEVASTGYFGGDLKVGTGAFDHASSASDVYVTGNLEVDGSVWLGDAAADTLTVTGSLSAANADMILNTLTVNGATTLGDLLQFTGTGHAGIRLNNLTTAQRDAITAATGMAFFNTTVDKMQVYDGASWKNVGNPEIGAEVTGGTAGSLLYVDGSGNLGQNNANFYWDVNAARLGLGTTAPSTKLHVSSGDVRIDNMSSAGFVKNDATGVLSGGNALDAGDIPTSNLANGTGISMTGTLASRLVGSGDNVTVNVASTVPTSITNDTNVTGSVANNVLTLGWTGQLSAARGGTGLNTSTAPSGKLLIGNGTGFTLAGITGTTNQVNVENGAGAITLSTPQDIGTASTPTFAGVITTSNVGVGTAAPLGLLQVGTSPNAPLIVTAAGKVGISNTAPSAGLTVGVGTNNEATSSQDVYIAGKLEVDGSVWLGDAEVDTLTVSGSLNAVNTSMTLQSLDVTGDTVLGSGAEDTVTLNVGNLILANTSAIDLANNLVSALSFESGLLSLDTQNARVGVGITAPTQALDVAGTVKSTGAIIGNLSGVLKASAGTVSGSATTDDLTEGNTNKYYTDTRARASLSKTDPITYNSTTGAIGLGYNTTNLKLTSNQLNTIQDIATTSTPSFAGITSTGASYLATAGGNVGIGTATALDLLHVSGPARFNDNVILRIGQDSAANIARINATDATGRLALGAGGAYNHLFIDTTGNIGIATTVPVGLLQVGTSPNVPLVVKADGKVGIGTTNPGFALDINSDSSNTQWAGQVAGITLRSTGNMVDSFGPRFKFSIGDNAQAPQEIAGISGVRDGADNKGRLQFSVRNGAAYDSNIAQLIIKSSGLVGIGTTDPNYNLEVASTGYFGGDLKVGSGTFDHASGASDAYITGNLEVDGSVWLGDAEVDTLTVSGSLNAVNTSMTLQSLDVTGDTVLGSGAEDTVTMNADNLVLSNASTINLANASTTSLNIESGLLNLDTQNARVGIGTTAPWTSLHLLAGGTLKTGASNNHVALTVQRSGADQSASIDIISADNRAGRIQFSDNANEARGVIKYDHGEMLADAMSFNTAGTTQMVIDSSGNVGLGTTAPSTKLHVSSGDVRIDNMSSAGFVKNDATGVLSGGNALDAGDIPTSNLANGTGISMTGTLASRLVGSGDNVTVNVASTVPTSITNDTNVTGSVANNVLTLGWTGQLSAARGGTGLNTSTAPSGKLLIGNGTGFTLAGITGTTNQVNVENGAGAITLSTPQDIGTASTPTFAGGTTTGDTNLATTSGNVGIGTVTPLGLLQVGTSPNVPLIVKASGNVGIGTTSPDASLTIQSANYPVEHMIRTTALTGGGFGTLDGLASAFKLTTKTSGNMTDGFGGGFVYAIEDSAGVNNTIARIYGRRDGADTAGALEFMVGANGENAAMILRGNGKIGIGTTAPNYNLEVASTGYFGGDVRLGTGTFDHASGAADAYITGNLEVDGSTWLGDAAADTLTVVGTLNAMNTSMTLQSLDVTGDTVLGSGAEDTVTLNADNLILANASTIDLANNLISSLSIESGLLSLDTQNARVGIGTTAPAQALEVAGTLKSTGAIIGALQGVLKAASGTVSGSATTDDLTEGDTNKYYTDTRARASLSSTDPVTYNSTTGAIGLGYNATNLKLTSNQLNTVQDITTASTPTFAGITSTGASYLASTSGNVGIGTNVAGSLVHVEGSGPQLAEFRQSATSGADAGIKIRGSRNATRNNDLAYVDLADYDSNEGSGTDFVMARVAAGMQDISGQTGILRFSTNTGSGLTPKMVIESGGNVGIGSTSPGSLLYVNGSSGTPSTANSLMTLRDSNTNIGFQMGATTGYGWIRSADILQTAYSGIKIGNGYVSVMDGNANDKVYMNTSSGNVGIGTASPVGLFQVGTSPNAPLLVTAAGKVGIGTTAPTAGLTVGTGTNNYATSASDVYVTGMLEVDGSSWLGDAAADTLTVIGSLNATNTSMTLQSLNVSGNSYLATTAGNVGIGTTSPGAALAVGNNAFKVTSAGTVTAGTWTGTAIGSQYGGTGVNSLTSSGVPKVTSGTWTVNATQDDLADGATYKQYNPASVAITGGTINNASIGASTPSTGAFTTLSSTQGATLATASGNVGIGTATAGALLDVIGGDIRINNSDITSRINLAGGRGYVGYNSSGNTIVLQGSSGKAVTFNVNNATFGSGEAMRITAGGNVGIGTTNPTSPLEVKSSGTSTNVYEVTASDGSLLSTLYEDSTGDGILSVKNSAGNTTVMLHSDSGSYILGSTGIGTSDPLGLLQVGTSPNAPLLVKVNGKVGIGNTNPSAGLTVGVGSNNNAAQINSAYIAGNLEVDGSVWLGDATTDNITITGTLSASNADLTIKDLTVNGNSILGDASSDTLTVNAGTLNLASNLTAALNIKSGAATLLNFDTQNTRLGIGTTAPEARLSVAGGDILLDNNKDIRMKDSSGTIRSVFTLDAANVLKVSNPTGNILLTATGGIIDTASNIHAPIFKDRNDASYYLDPSSAANSLLVAGNIGIGTTTPTAKLTVAGTDGGVITAILQAVNGQSADILRIQSPTSNLVSVTSSGNLGIGTTAPANKLSVQGSSSIGATYANIQAAANSLIVEGKVGVGTSIPTAGLTVGVGSNSHAAQADSVYVAGNLEVDGSVWLGDAAADSLTIVGTLTASNADMTIRDLTVNGNTVVGDTSSDTMTLNAATLSLANASTLNLASMQTSSLNIKSGTTTLLNFDTQNTRVGIGTTAPLGLFQVGTTPAPGLLVTTSGKVGIGTSIPAVALHVAENVRASRLEIDSATKYIDTSSNDLTFTDPNAGTITLTDLSGGLDAGGSAPKNATYITQTPNNTLNHEQALSALATGYMKVTTGTGVVTSQVTPIPVGDGGTGTSNGSITGTSALTFTAGGTNQNVRLTPSGTGYTVLDGNVGIGTASPAANLEVKNTAGSGDIFKLTNSAGNTAFIIDNGTLKAKFYASGGMDHAALGFLGTTGLGYGSNGQLSLITGSSNKVTIDTAGNVGIGDTAPLGLLQVGTSPNAPLVVRANGKIGIGNTTPTAGLTVGIGSNNNATSVSDVYIAGRLEVDGSTWLGDTGADNLTVTGTLSATNATMTLKKLTVTEDTALATTAGNVGIGTANPTAAHIQEASSNLMNLQLEETGSGSAAQIVLKNPSRTWDFGADSSPDGFFIQLLGGNQDFFFINPSGNVGLGTTAPGAKLEVNGNMLFKGSANPQILLNENTSNAARISHQGAYNTGFLQLQSYSSNWDAPGLVIQGTAGNVGVGLTNPSAKLHVVENSANPAVILTNAGGGLALKVGSAGMESQGKTWLATDSAASVGVGTTDPQNKLHIVGSGVTPTAQTITTMVVDGGVNDQYVAKFIGNDDAYAGFQIKAAQANVKPFIQWSNAAAQAMTMSMEDNATWAIREGNIGGPVKMIVKSGNVGIGTTSPESLLDVASPQNVSAAIRILDSNDSNNVRIALGNNTNGGYILGKDINEIERFLIRTYPIDGTQAYFNAGNVGIGTTNPNYALEVASTGYFGGDIKVGSGSFDHASGASDV
ncbi:MAG: hypothetical protein PHQ43_02695, partial [Dehalococcoidales bacterium]|nr:hypothetical protein [Dehalococcoidales bacterium]